jgi:hypothetical protein
MISILMPVYNCPPDLLEKALVSVFKQTYADWEIVIKDGNIYKPAIQSPKICSLIKTPNTKVKYFCEPESADRANRQNSYYEALNWCIENSKGDILTVLAGDDERGGPFVLEHVADEFEKHGPSSFCLYGACEWVNHAGEHLVYKQPPVLPVTFDVILNDFPFYTPAVFWNRAVHAKFGLYDTSYPWSADLDFWLKTWRGIDSKFTPEVIGKYRQWSVSQQRDNGDLAGQEGTRILEKWRALR